MRNGEGEGAGLALAPLASLEATAQRAPADRRTDLAAAKDDMAASFGVLGLVVRGTEGVLVAFGFESLVF